MTEPLGIGMVGAGMVGQLAHLANFARLADCRVVGLAELRPDLGRQAAERYGIGRLYGSHHEMLDDPEIGAVVVVTRRPATGPVVRDCLSAGRHVLSEKPMAHTVEQATSLVRLAEERHLTYAIGFMKRHDAGFELGVSLHRDLLASNELGAVLLVRAWCHPGNFAPGVDGFVMTPEPRPDGLELWPDHPGWLPDALATRYADFLNVYLHDINALRALTGQKLDPVAVHLRGPGMVVMMDSGTYPVVLEMGAQGRVDWSEGIEVQFARGSLTIAFPPPLLANVPAEVSVRRPSGVQHYAAPASWAFRRQAEAFVQDVRSGRTPRASGQDGIEDLRLAERIWEIHVKGTVQ